jgi:enoyl-CoA hydratase/carnithine racemase
VSAVNGIAISSPPPCAMLSDVAVAGESATARVADLGWEVDPDGIARLTLDRPQAGNAITPDQRETIIALLSEASGRPDIRTIVLTGAGTRHFCTGADLSASAPRQPRRRQRPPCPPGRWRGRSPAARNG